VNILILTLGNVTLPSSRLRWINYRNDFEEAGINVDFCTFNLFKHNGVKYDVCILQKKIPNKREINLLKKISKKIVFDIDDIVWKLHPNNYFKPRQIYYSLLSKILLKNLSFFDHVIVSNDFLFNKLKYINSKISIIPTSPSDNECDVINKETQDVSTFVDKKKKIIGWTGTKENIYYLNVIKKDLSMFLRNNKDWILIIVSDGQFILDNKELDSRVYNVPWSLNSESFYINLFDIGIMPLSYSSWEKGKAAYKLINYMKHKIVGVATNFGYQKQFIINGQNGILVSKDDSWSNALSLLARDEELRNKIALSGYQTYQMKFSKKIIFSNILDLLNFL